MSLFKFSFRDVTGPKCLRILDLQVSKLHCEIIYLRRKEMFALKDCGSQNGTFINNSRLSEVNTELLGHKDM